MKNRIWTLEEKQFLEDNIKGTSYKEMCDIFNKKFNLNVSVTVIAAAIKRYGLSNGIDGCFKKGNKPLKPLPKGQNESRIGFATQYKKGRISPDRHPIGSERFDSDGYWKVKVADPNIWKLKHRILWEKEKGPIPKEYCLIFKDGNVQNITIDNLALVTKGQNLHLNKQQIAPTPDNFETRILMVNIKLQIGKLKAKRSKGNAK